MQPNNTEIKKSRKLSKTTTKLINRKHKNYTVVNDTKYTQTKTLCHSNLTSSCTECTKKFQPTLKCYNILMLGAATL